MLKRQQDNPDSKLYRHKFQYIERRADNTYT